MSKGPWEGRVGKLLGGKDFAYYYKPVDGEHAGPVKIDWLACDRYGYFWMIEVKQIDKNAQRFPLSIVTPLQRMALLDAARANHSVVLLAVGRGKDLLLYDWRKVWQQQELSVYKADVAVRWNKEVPKVGLLALWLGRTRMSERLTPAFSEPEKSL